jgi:hypothetical protein
MDEVAAQGCIFEFQRMSVDPQRAGPAFVRDWVESRGLVCAEKATSKLGAYGQSVFHGRSARLRARSGRAQARCPAARPRRKLAPCPILFS